MTTTKIEYNTLDVFQKDIKKLLKRFRTLEEDLEVVKRDVIEFYHLRRIDNQSVFPMQGFCTQEIQICKIKKIACKALKGKGCRSGIRIVYAFFPNKNKVEFIQIYYKEREDTDCDYERIKNYLKLMVGGQ